MGVRGRYFLLGLLAFALHSCDNEGTILASASETTTPTRSSSSTWSGSGTGAQGQILEEINSKNCYTPRISPPEEHQGDEHPGVELSVPPSGRCEKFRREIVLQQLRCPLPNGEMVAAGQQLEFNIEIKEQEASRTGTRQEEDSCGRRVGEGLSPIAAFRHRWIGSCNTSSMGGDNPDQNSHSYDAAGGQSAGERRKYPSGGEDRRFREDRDAQEGSPREGPYRHHHLGDHRGGGKGDQGERCATSDTDAQDVAPIAEDREAMCGGQSSSERTGCKMGSVERVHEKQVYGAGQPLQRKKEGTATALPRAHGQADIVERGGQESGKRGERSRDTRSDPRDRRPILRRYGTGDFRVRRRQGQGQKETCFQSSDQFTGESSKEVRFDESVRVSIFDEWANEPNVNFSVRIDQFPDWDSKPWALHGGAFVYKAQEAMMRIATPLGVPREVLHPEVRDCEVSLGHHEGDGARDSREGRDGTLHHGDLRGDGDTGARSDGGERVHDAITAEGREAVIHTYGVRGGYLGRRSRRISLDELEDEGKLQAIARSMWRGETEGTVHCCFPIPQPQPLDPSHLAQKFMLVDLLHSEDPMHLGRVPVLCDVYAWTGESRQRRTFAAMLPSRATWHGIVGELSLRQVCTSRVGNQCIIRIGWDLRLDDTPAEINPTDLITINYDQPEGEGDLITLLQRRHGHVEESTGGQVALSTSEAGRISSTPATREAGPTRGANVEGAFLQLQEARGLAATPDLLDAGIVYHMFHRRTAFRSATITARDPFREREQIARAWQVDVEEIRGVIPIRCRPSDFPIDGSLVVITEWDIDGDAQTFDRDVLVLIDIEIHSGTGETSTKLFRQVNWSRHTISRQGLLNIAMVADYCRHKSDDRCLVWKNNVLWPLQETGEKQIASGDYLRIAVPAEDGRDLRSTCRFLYEAEQAARDHIVFGLESDADESEEEETEYGDEMSDTPYGRPPSLPEPEPHDTEEICYTVEDVHKLCKRDEEKGKSAHLILHGLRCCTIGTRFARVRHLSTSSLLDAVNKKWEQRAGWRRTLHVIQPQPHQPDQHHVHLLVEYRPLGWRILRQPFLHQQVQHGSHYVRTILEARYRKQGEFYHHNFEVQGSTEDDETPGPRGLPEIVRLRIHTTLTDPRHRVHDVEWPRELVSSTTCCIQSCQVRYPHLADCTLEILSILIGKCTVHALAHPAHSNASLCLRYYGNEGGYHAEAVQHEAHATPQSILSQVFEDVEKLEWARKGRLLECWTTQPKHPPKATEDFPFGLGCQPCEGIPTFDGSGIYRRAIPITLDGRVDGDEYRPQSNAPPEVNDNGLDFTPVFDLWKWLDASYPSVRWSLPEGVDWHWATSQWITEWWDLGSAEELYVYTDGAANGTTSAAAAVFFARSNGVWYYAGYLRQDLAGGPCAHRAELHGILLGYHWINATLHRLSYTQATMPRVGFGFDATSAGYRAFGQWGGHRYETLIASMRALCYFIEARFCITIMFEHVYGHCAHPGNEAANTVAQMKVEEPLLPSVWVQHFDVSKDWEVQWLWAIWKPEWKFYWREGRVYLPEGPSSRPSPELFDFRGPETLPGEQQATVHNFECKLATANVLTLLPSSREGGLYGQARTELLQHMFHENGYHIIGLQETRQKKESKIDQENFYVFSAAANSRGQYGVQIWIAKSLHLGTSRVRFERHHFKIVYRSCRILVLRVVAPFWRSLLVCAHAPTSQSGEEEISAWWTALKKATPSKYKQWPHVLLADANSHVGSHVSDAVGGHQAEEQDHGGHEMQLYLDAYGIWLPATYQICHNGDGGTWRHPRYGIWKRGDYVGIPRQWQLGCCESFVDASIDLALKKEDHRVAAVKIQWQGQLRGTDAIVGKGTPPLAVDLLREHLQGERREETLQDLAQYVPETSWNMDVHTHTALFQQGMRQWLQRNYIRGPRRPRRRLSERTWELVCEKRNSRDALFAHDRVLQRRILQACWEAWRPWKADDNGGLLETREEAFNYAKTLHTFRQLGSQVTYSLRQDDKDFFENMAKETGYMDTPGKSREFWRRIRGAFPKFKEKAAVSPLSMEVLDTQWLPHFSRLEAGSATTPAQLLSGCVQRQTQSNSGAIQLQDMPTRQEVETILRSLQPNKSAGPDGVPADLFRNAAVGLAAHTHDLYCKMTYWCAEPVQAKGGRMHPILKRGDPAVAGNYRGVMLLDVISKAYHRWLRQQLTTTLEVFRMDTQIGGFKGQQATFGAQTIQTVARIAHCANCPMACVFVDVQGAYHFLVRELVVGPGAPQDVEAVLSNLDEWQTDTRGLKKWLELPGLMERARYPRWLTKVLREVHTDTWAQLPAIQQMLRTSRGSRPGSPLADIVYGVLMWDLHIEIHRILEETPAVVQGFQAVSLDPLAVTWADDLAIPILVQTNLEVIPAVTEVLGRTYKAFERRGLLLNMQKGKTAAVLAFRGPQAVEHRTQYLLSGNPGLQIDIDAERSVWLHFCSSYKHLGSLFTPGGEIQCEVQSRLGQAKLAWGSLKKFLFGNRWISIKTRLQLFESLIVSRLCYGLSSWGHIMPKNFQSVEAFIQRSQRYICGVGHQDGVTTDELISKYKFPNLQQRLAVARISYAVKLWAHGPPTLQNLLWTEAEMTNTAWWHYLQEDMRWCRGVVGTMFPTATLEMQDLAASWRAHPTLWKRILKKAMKIGIMQETIAADVRMWHYKIIKALVDNGAQVAGHQEGQHETQFPCPDCPRVFSTVQGLTSHRRFAHDYEAPEAKWARGTTTCRVCLRYFWTTARLQQHLSYMPRSGEPNPCYAELCKYGLEDLSTEQEEGIPKIALATTHGINRRDALQAQGPLPIRVDPQAVHYEVACEEWSRKKEDYNAKFQCPPEVRQAVAESLTSTTTSWFEALRGDEEEALAKEALQEQWMLNIDNNVDDNVDQDELAAAFMQWGRQELPTVYAEWMSGYAESWAEEAFVTILSELEVYKEESMLDAQQNNLQGIYKQIQDKENVKPHRPVKRGPVTKRGSRKTVRKHHERYHDDDGWHHRWTQYALDFGIADRAVPYYKSVAARPVFLILHLFSGRRREQDFHWHLAEMVKHASFNVHILSLDTAIDAAIGNLAWTGTTWDRVLGLLRDGKVASGLAGPPCETFSAARHNEAPEGLVDKFGRQVRWPRPLRSAQRPWGLVARTLRELRQAYVGSQLALQTVLAVTWILIGGGSFLTEHPSPPEDPEKVSLFRSPVVELLRQFPEVKLKVVQQGDFGAKSCKPTGLLAVRMPNLFWSLARWKDATPPERRETAIGVDGTGRFRTASLKEYPRSFSKGLAQAVFDSLQGRVRRGDLRMASLEDSSPSAVWLAEALYKTAEISGLAGMQPDYQPQFGG